MYSSLRNQPHDYILMIVYASVSQAWVAEQWRVLCCISHLLFVLFRFSQAQSQSGRQGDQALTSVSGSRTSLQRSLKHTKRKACIACHQRQVQGPYRGGRGEGLSLSTDHCITCLMVTSTDFCFWRFDAVLQESERYAYEWQRCLENALEVCGCFFFLCLCVSVSDLIRVLFEQMENILKTILWNLVYLFFWNAMCILHWTVTVPWGFQPKLCMLSSVSQGFWSVFLRWCLS